MKSIIKKVLFFLTGNIFFQKLLERLLLKGQYLMGMGSGSYVSDSGEYAIIKELKELKNKSYCIFDVGAHKGDFTRLTTSYFTDNEPVKVHCFEPLGATFKSLSSNFNDDSRVILNNIGLGKQEGMFDLFYDSEVPGGRL